MNAQHQCQDCQHSFWSPGQSQGVSPAAQCPHCHSYRTQPAGMPDEANDMLHGLQSMPDSTQDDMSGNPYGPGENPANGSTSDGGWKDRSVRDESFNSSYRRADFPSMFEAPEFETTELIAPPDLYRTGLEAEHASRTPIQLPHGITDNLHAALGNSGAWVENPHENGQLRPYNQYWKSIRPQYMKPGGIQIGVADPTMAEIINHVAQTDDLTPLYEYRGHRSAFRYVSGLAGDIESGLADLAPIDQEIPGLDVASDVAAVGKGAGMLGKMKSLLGKPQTIGGGLATKALGVGVNSVDDLLGMGSGQNGGGTSIDTAPAQNDYSSMPMTAGLHWSSDEDAASPSSHDEIPKNDDGDAKQKSDGNSHEWQRDLSVNDIGGAEHSPSFRADGPGVQMFKALEPLIDQLLASGEDGSQHPDIMKLHQLLDSELPGYLDHDPASVMIISGEPGDKAHPEHSQPDHTDENSGGAHESRTASLTGEACEFLPDFDVTLPDLHRPTRVAAPMMAPPMPGGMPGGAPGGMAPSPMSGPSPMAPMAAPPAAPGDVNGQGPITDEQQAWFADWLRKQGRDDEIANMIENPQLYAKEFARARGLEAPPEAPGVEGDDQSAQPPMPAQEEAPPGDTMPVPGMATGQQSMSSRQSADSVASACPQCGGHTTGIIDDDGTSQCHGCKHIFKTDGLHPVGIKGSSIMEADAHDFDLDSGHAMPQAPVEGVPIADQQQQPSAHEPPDRGHAWLDSSGAPLQVGQEYEMYSEKYDIPDLVRIDAVKPTSIHYTLTGEYGIDHSTELTKQEAHVERLTFEPTGQNGGETGPADDGSLEANNDDNTAYTGDPGHTDLSAPHGLVSASTRQSGVREQNNPRLAWLTDGMRTAGASYTAMEQRDLIDETGSARNADRLSLAGTHYVTGDEDEFLFGV